MRPSRKTIRLENHRLVVQITDDRSRTLIDPETQVAYHSGSGAVAETRHVYLGNSGIAERLSSGLATSVLEIGLGTGMAMLLTLDAALAANAPLDYTAFESEWLATRILRELQLDDHLDDASTAERFLVWRNSLGDPVPEGVYQWDAGPNQRVTVHHGDALGCDLNLEPRFDAVYFDPFAPDENPELWQSKFLAKMHTILRDQGCLVTYCVNRQVRDRLSSAGFDVARVNGPKGGKRQVMVARKIAPDVPE